MSLRQSIEFDIAYDDSTFPECRGWRPSIGLPEEAAAELTDIYGPGLDSPTAAMAACEKWAKDRGYELVLIQVVAVSAVAE